MHCFSYYGQDGSKRSGNRLEMVPEELTDVTSSPDCGRCDEWGMIILTLDIGKYMHIFCFFR